MSLHSSKLTCRFLFFESDFNRSTRKVKSSIFSVKPREGFSIFNIKDINDCRIWGLAVKHVLPSMLSKGRKLLGRFDLKAKYYYETDMSIKKSSPFPRHHDVYEFPVSTDIHELYNLGYRQLLVTKAHLKLIDDNEEWKSCNTLNL